MTGYGRGTAEREGRRVGVEIRSVNHRFLDLKVRGATLPPAVEEQLTGAVKARVERGSVTVTVRHVRGGAASPVQVDREVAARAHRELQELATHLGLGRPDLALVCAQPGVLVPAEDDDDETLAQVIVEAAGRALEAMVSMRDTEGAAMARDLAERLDRLGDLVEEVSRHAEVAPEEAQRRLQERVGRLVANAKVQADESRIAQEVALLADRLDVTEELVRLRSHIDQVREVTKRSGAIGRRLDFLVQEMGREFNTVASKSQSADIARAVVEAKAELERVREQVQNIE